MPLYNPSSAAASTDGWTADSRTWTYASATTFTVSGVDVTAQFPKGTRIKLTQTTVKYFVVVGSSFSTNTTVTITGGSDYTFANAAVTSPFYSYEASPQGYPGVFNYTPSWTGFSADPSSVIAQFAVIGRTCFLNIRPGSAGTSNATSLTVSLPVASITLAYEPCARVQDNGAFKLTPGLLEFTVASTVSIYVDAAGGTWTASGAKSAQFTCDYAI